MYRREKYNETPVLHHLVLLELVQRAVDGTLVHPHTGNPCSNLMVLMPPGAAKSTYISKDAPPWILQRRKGCRILACSYSAELIESFSRDCRNTVEMEAKVLGYSLSPDSRAVAEWSTTNGGTYRCMGIGAGISGRRADIAYIDDYIGSEEDADSKLIRDKQWTWYNGDFWPRLKPQAVQIIVANTRHEDDLVGRILAREEKSWVVVRIPFFAKENDALGRPAGDRSMISHIDFNTATAEDIVEDPKAQIFLDSRLWPEYFTRLQAAKVLKMPARTQSGLYGQSPAPEDGDYFKSEWLKPYTRAQYEELMKSNVRIYGAGDWAVSEQKDANRVCLGTVAVNSDSNIYILPDLFWKISGPKDTCVAFVNLCERRKPDIFWSEKGHISQAIGPFLREMMRAEEVYTYIKEHVPSKAKDVRARSIQGRMSMGTVFFPKFASWWPEAEHELLHFPSGKTDDFVDFLAHIGLGLGQLTKAFKPKPEQSEELDVPFKPTLAWLKGLCRDTMKKTEPKYGGR